MMRALSRRVSTPLWSVVVLFVISVLLSAAAYLGAVSYYHAEQAAAARQAEAQKAAQAAQSAAFEAKLCTSLERLAGLEPPPGPPGDNPSRAYLAQQHQVLAELGPDVGCPARSR
jgi:type II secretory pathway pseudopilin PulG